MPESPRPNTPESAPAQAGKATPDAAERRAAQPDGFTLDLSSGPSKAKPASWKRKQKQASLVFTKVMDLSSPAPAPPVQPEKQSAPHIGAPKNIGAPKKEKKRERPHSGGSTLADLLDAETLARLRGEDDG
ncbi:MAG: hypothetical protein HKN04_13565 [Rhodothermaceae bacterium]|nr:hypothetical protein [Rhodothermaceae bacterium]